MKWPILSREVWEARRRWLTLGMGVKRWLLILGIGALVAGIGIESLLVMLRQERVLPAAVFRLLTLQFVPPLFRVLLPLVLGGAIMFSAIVRLSSNLVAPFRRPGEEVVHSLYDHIRRSRGPQIVAIGGGTGLPSLLRGLTHFTRNITAVVTVADDGGSSGRLRRDLGILPPGDFRNNIAALARDETLMAQLLQYRFGRRLDANGAGEDALPLESGELQGHAFGNLLLAALTGITGSFDEALLAAERVLAMRGRVLPSTLENVTLAADIVIGDAAVSTRVAGESAIPKVGGRIKRLHLQPADARAYPPVIRAILEADMVIIGPGSLYTSILPNLLIPGIADALRRTRAVRIYVCNLAAQPGETDNYTVADHVVAINKHLTGQAKGVDYNWLDVVLANDNLSVAPDAGGGKTVFVWPQGLDEVPMVESDLVDLNRPWRHDSSKLARIIVSQGLKKRP